MAAAVKKPGAAAVRSQPNILQTDRRKHQIRLQLQAEEILAETSKKVRVGPRLAERYRRYAQTLSQGTKI